MPVARWPAQRSLSMLKTRERVGGFSSQALVLENIAERVAFADGALAPQVAAGFRAIAIAVNQLLLRERGQVVPSKEPRSLDACSA